MFFAQTGKSYLRNSPIAAASIFCVMLPHATSAQTIAGISIENIAQASYTLDGKEAQIASSAAILRTAEVLDIALSTRATTIDAAATGTVAIAFQLHNPGNGLEAFALEGSCDGGKIIGFAADTDGDGIFDATRDVVLAEARTTRLKPGASQHLFALLDQVAASGAKLTVLARADTASGTSGALSPGRGDDGVDAVVGTTMAEATLQFTIAAGSSAQATLMKSQSVTRRKGGSEAAMANSIVTYSLVARFTGGTARDAVISDPIPAGTRYIPGTLTIDSAIISDAVDADAGSFDGQSIRAELGAVVGAAERTVTFQVVIE